MGKRSKFNPARCPPVDNDRKFARASALYYAIDNQLS